MRLAERLRRLLPGLWLGLLLAIALLAAPSLFALLERADAGRVAGRLFALEARTSLVLAVLLILLERARSARRAEEAGAASRLTAELLLVLGALFCTVLGHYALDPMIAAARAGTGRWSFAALHGAATGFYALKTLLVAALAWRSASGPAA